MGVFQSVLKGILRKEGKTSLEQLGPAKGLFLNMLNQFLAGNFGTGVTLEVHNLEIDNTGGTTVLRFSGETTVQDRQGTTGDFQCSPALRVRQLRISHEGGAFHVIADGEAELPRTEAQDLVERFMGPQSD